MVDENEEPETKSGTSMNLEDSCFIELDRPLVISGQSEEDLLQETAAPIQELSYRCDSTERELLKNHFPVND